MKYKVLFPIIFVLVLILSVVVEHPKYYQKLPKSKQKYIGVWVNESQGDLTVIGIGKDRGLLVLKNSGNSKICFSSEYTTPSFENKKIKIPGFFFFSNYTYSIDSPPSKKFGDWVMTLNGKRFHREQDQLNQDC